MEFTIGTAQEMIDSGISVRETGRRLGLNHMILPRAIKKGLIDTSYTPFDEESDKQHLHQNFEWLWEEDKLEELTNEAFDNGEVIVNELLEENFLSVGKYVSAHYGTLRKYLIKRNVSMLTSYILFKCPGCNENKDMNGYFKSKDNPFGIMLNECKTCGAKRVRDYKLSNEEYAERCKESNKRTAERLKGDEEHKKKIKVWQMNRRAMKALLPDTLTVNQIEAAMSFFNGGCALTNQADDLHLDHVIPLSIGRGGTTFENIIPLSGTLNISKHDGNLFEWFKSNRQRFNLSQKKFDKLIDYLANLNDMTIDEYRDYVYWCHANPRTVNDLRKGGR